VLNFSSAPLTVWSLRLLVNCLNRAKPVEPVELDENGFRISIRHLELPPGAEFQVGAPNGLVWALARFWHPKRGLQRLSPLIFRFNIGPYGRFWVVKIRSNTICGELIAPSIPTIRLCFESTMRCSRPMALRCMADCMLPGGIGSSPWWSVACAARHRKRCAAAWHSLGWLEWCGKATSCKRSSTQCLVGDQPSQRAGVQHVVNRRQHAAPRSRGPW